MIYQAISSIRVLLRAGLLVALVTMLMIESVGAARQDDPFSTNSPANPASPQAKTDDAAPAIDPALPEGVRLIIQSVRETNPVTPTNLARAIKTMLDIEQYDEARYYLNRLINSGADATRIVEMHQRLGSDFFFRLHSQPQLLPDGRQYARSVLETVRREAMSPARIEGLIQQLSNQDSGLRSDAFAKLKRLGAPAAAAMLNTVNDPSRDSEFGRIQTALVNMDQDALMPLLGAARADGTAAQLAAVRALGKIPHRLAVDTLYRAYLSSQVPAPTREIARQSLAAQTREILSAASAESHLHHLAWQYLRGKQSLPHSADNSVSTWRWDANSKKLVERRVDELTALRLMANDLASDLYELNPDSAQNRRLYLITVLEATKRLAGSDRTTDFESVRRFLRDVTAPDIDAALASAMRLELVPAAVAAAEILEEIGTAELLSTPSNRPCNLVRALVSGQRQLMYAAARAIARIDPEHAFVGSSYMMRTAVYLANSRGVSVGLVGDPRSAIAQTYAASIGPAGLVGRSVTSSRELFELAIRDPDVEIILIGDSLADPGYLELAQQIRSNWRTKRVPIGILARDVQRAMQAESTLSQDPLLLVMPMMTDPDKIFEQVRRLQSLADAYPITNDQRRAQADFAIGWLTKIVSDRERYRFYDPLAYQSELVGSFTQSGAIPATSEMLSRLGSPLAQRALVDFASETAAPIAARKIAANAFDRSVKSHGTLLTTREIQLQYDRFNASQTQSEELQSVLASILDSIESRVKPAE